MRGRIIETEADRIYTAGQDDQELTAIQNLMETQGWSEQQAMDALKVPADKQKYYATKLAEEAMPYDAS